MKKLLFAIFLLSVGFNAYAQKQYLSLIVNLNDKSYESYYTFAYLSGDLPEGMTYKVTYEDVNAPKTNMSYPYNSKTSLGLLLNILSEKGFSVESTMSQSENTLFILSRASQNTSNAIQRVIIDNDEEVTEVARYNLQGMPIGKNEKGIQIVVYSNYTTKTIIVE